MHGAERVNSFLDVTDNTFEDDEAVENNHTKNLILWRWVVVYPTSLRTSSAYSKVSLYIYIMMETNQFQFRSPLASPSWSLVSFHSSPSLSSTTSFIQLSGRKPFLFPPQLPDLGEI